MLHGAPLPKPGSFQERLLSESILRERNERMAFITAIVKMLTLVGGVNPEAAQEILEDYREELYQFRYNYRYETYSTKLSTYRRQEQLETHRMMQRLEAMTVEDDDIKQIKEN